MESIIKQKIDLIAECIFDKIQKGQRESYGLYSEEFGFLLFLLYYLKYSKSEKYTSLTEDYAEKLLENSVTVTGLHTFCSGLSGILYLFEFLREYDFIDIDVNDVQTVLDNYLVTRMRQDIRQQNYDFMHGALGVGLYFMKRGNHPEYIQELIDFLYSTAEKDTNNSIFKWESIIDHEKNNRGYNLSLSHGISSIIIFLARVVKSGKSETSVVEMLTGAINYILSQEKDFTQFGSYFSSHIPKDSTEPVLKSRLAWCYGDLGIGMALWQAGKALEKKEWEDKGFEILLQSTQRRSFKESFVQDARICHGSAGIVMIYRRMYLETKESKFQEAIRYWINQTLNFSRFEDGLAGYKALYKDEWRCDYSLLTGIAGIGLVLLSYLSENQQIWDEMLLLS